MTGRCTATTSRMRLPSNGIGVISLINIVEGDLLEASEDLIVHQVNCFGYMGAGVAKQIREKWPTVYEGYHALCKASYWCRRELLGSVYWKCIGYNKYIGNIFGQYNVGPSEKRQTNYGALREGLLKVRDFCEGGRYTVAMPYRIGCGNGGGDWENEVLPMIEKVFEGYEVTLYKKL